MDLRRRRSQNKCFPARDGAKDQVTPTWRAKLSGSFGSISAVDQSFGVHWYEIRVP